MPTMIANEMGFDAHSWDPTVTMSNRIAKIAKLYRALKAVLALKIALCASNCESEKDTKNCRNNDNHHGRKDDSDSDANENYTDNPSVDQRGVHSFRYSSKFNKTASTDAATANGDNDNGNDDDDGTSGSIAPKIGPPVPSFSPKVAAWVYARGVEFHIFLASSGRRSAYLPAMERAFAFAASEEGAIAVIVKNIPAGIFAAVAGCEDVLAAYDDLMACRHRASRVTNHSKQRMYEEAINGADALIENVFEEGSDPQHKTAAIATCRNCGSSKIHSTRSQTRSADEGQTTFCMCLKCGSSWKDSN